MKSFDNKNFRLQKPTDPYPVYDPPVPKPFPEPIPPTEPNPEPVPNPSPEPFPVPTEPVPTFPPDVTFQRKLS